MNVAVYVRVSTETQTTSQQLLQLKEYCEKSNWTIFNIYSDEYVSGRKDSRPEYDKLFRDAHKKKFDVVLFWSLDRFSRSGTSFTLSKLSELEHLHIQWHSYTEPYISSVGPWKDVVISIFATIAKIEAQRISERTKAKLDEIKREIEENKQYKTKSGNVIEKLGRPTISDSVTEKVEQYLKEGLSYSKISELVTYTAKYGVVKNISISQICQINKRLKNGCKKT